MKHPSITQFSHWLIEQHLTDPMIAVDATAGNGNDTLALATRARHVYAFDIQKQALDQAKQLCSAMSNITWILDSHDHMRMYVQEPVDFIIFNFGYLPGGDHTVTTMTETSRSAVIQALELLSPQGLLVLCFYPGHPEGKQEMEAILAYLRQQPVLLSHYETDLQGAPVCYLVSHRTSTAKNNMSSH